MSTEIDTLKGNVIEKNLGTIIQNFINEPKNPIETQVVYNVVGLGSKVYGRVDEAKILADALYGRADFGAKRFFLIVAPSGFGKSYLLTKALQDVTDGKGIKPDYEQTVQRIIRLDCRNTKSITDIIREFTNIIGLSFAYPPDFGFRFEYFNGILFHYVRNVGRVWLILDNFEAWLDGENDYEPINDEVEDFLKALFEGNHTLRGVFLSQSLPINFIRQKVKTLDTVGDNLYQGLPKDDALLMLREGEGVDFSDVSDELLVEFLEKVAYIPQAINSLLGYMQDGATLDEVLHTPEFERGFETYESDAARVEEGERRTNALIARQIKSQSADIKLVLQALAYFGKPLPAEALESLFDDKLKARNAITRLKTHRLASEIKELSGTYYDLHTYFRRQTRIVLPDFSRIVDAVYGSALIYEKGNESFYKGFLEKALNLYECAEKIFRDLFDTGRADLEMYIAAAKNARGYTLANKGKLDEAMSTYDDSIQIYERLINEMGNDELSNDLALAYINKSETLRDLNKLTEAIEQQDKAIEIRERLVNELGQEEFSNDLADAYLGKGNSLFDSGEMEEATKSYDDAVKIRERLVNELGQDQFANDLAKAFCSRGAAYSESGKPDEAIANYDEAIKIYERLTDELGQDQIAGYLARVFMNKGIAFSSQGKFDEAVKSYDISFKIRETCLERGQYQGLPDFVRNIQNRVKVLLALEDWQRTVDDIITGFDFEEHWKNIELSDFFKQQMKEYQDNILILVLTVSPKKREEIYKLAGKYGKEIKQLVKNYKSAIKN